MAGAMDFYSSTTALQSDPFTGGGELMEALEPFMKSASPSTTPPSQSLPSTSSSSYNYFPFSPSISPLQPSLYPDNCSTSMTHVFSRFSIHDPLGLQQQPGSIGLNHLTPSQIHQIQAQIHLQNQQFTYHHHHHQQPQQFQNQQHNTLNFLSPKFEEKPQAICQRFAEEERISDVAVVLSESCSFTTDPSPNGRLRRVITPWQKGELLGRGSFGSVYEGISCEGFFFAVKEVSLLDQGSQGKESILQLEQEIALLSRFAHENIVQYLGTDRDESNLYIFLELVKGSLLNLYQKYILRDSQVSAYTRQILHGLKYLHDQNVVHRDIKCANILVDTSGSVKLADFGLAKATTLNDVKSCKGSAFWMAPEVVNGKNHGGYGLPADIWSLGCTVLEMLTRQLPYSDLECVQALYRIGQGVPPHVPDSLSEDARNFILRCLEVNPNDRPTAAQLLDHPFVKGPLLTSSGSASPDIGRLS